MLLLCTRIAGEHENAFEFLVNVGARPVCCSPDCIFVAHEREVDVHSWTGHRITELSLEQLGITRDICAIQCNHDGTVLQLAGRDYDEVFSLHTYKVSSTFMLSYTSHGFIIHPLLSEGKENNISAAECALC